MVKNKKKKNMFVEYFTPFGLKQLCDVTMIAAAIVLIVGLSVHVYTPIVALVGSVLMSLGGLFALFRTIPVFFSGKNKRSMAFKNAVINTVIMGIIFGLAIFTTIFICIDLL